MSGLLGDLSNAQPLDVSQAWAAALGQPGAFGGAQQGPAATPALHWNGSAWVNPQATQSAVATPQVAQSNAASPQQAAAAPVASSGLSGYWGGMPGPGGVQAPASGTQTGQPWNAAGGGQHWDGSKWVSPAPQQAAGGPVDIQQLAQQIIAMQQAQALAQQKAQDERQRGSSGNEASGDQGGAGGAGAGGNDNSGGTESGY
jgi:hypothetical protein